ncbi:aspartate kinase [Candidatus Gottesmanbacteria bacterium]|nr:aspartate kinase [Candidatus Gottesmanbacteria bacterium]
MKVMKFGGTSVGNGERILNVAKIIKKYAREEKIVVVVSAMSGVTDRLIAIFQKYKNKQLSEAMEEMNSLYQFHFDTLKELKLEKEKFIFTENTLKYLFGQLLCCLSLERNYTAWNYDFVISFGERFSALFLTQALQKIQVKSKEVDSSQLILTTDEFGSAKVLLTGTKKQVQKMLLPLIFFGTLPVITGFYGATKDGRVATLGRGGSDYSATALAYALSAKEVILWKEVDGIFNGDPKKGQGVKLFKRLSYGEALQLAKNGAKVLHPQALKPVAEKEIVVRVKNTFKPKILGTKIWKGKTR